MRWPKYWSFSFSIIPSKEIPGLISFRMDWLENFLQNGGKGYYYSISVAERPQPSTQKPLIHRNMI